MDRQGRRDLNTGSKAWRSIRIGILQRDRYTCRDCGRFGGHVDHIDGDNANHSADNLQTLCLPCHSRKTATEQTGRPYIATGCDAHGNPRSPNRHWR